MMFWKARDNDVSHDRSNKDDSHVEANDATVSSSVNNQIGTCDESTQQIHGIPMIPLSSSLSKRAVHIMNITSGLCADPLHFHSFATVGSGWMIPSPKSFFVGAFQKCVACHGRLGGSASIACDNQGEGSPAAISPEINSSSGMLQCVACGVYAHRTCAFARPTSSGKGFVGNIPPLCEVNLNVIQKAFGMSREKIMDVSSQPAASTRSSSWSLFGKISLTTDDNGVDTNGEEKAIPNPNEGEWKNSLLEEKKDPTAVQTEEKPMQKPGMIETSFKLIQKTTETAKHIPTAGAIGMVAGGAAGLAIAGPAGCIVGSQIGRTVLAAGAVVEGGLGISVLVMSLAAAANFHLPSASEKERELKFNSTLVLVRPDIAVDPIWGEYANEARESWEQKHHESSQSKSSCGSFGFGHIFSTSATKEELSMRYRKDSDIIKADASELPMREKVVLLVNRILNDKMSLPGYQYRYLILKHKRRTMFGDEGSTEDAEELSIRSCRQDAHGVIKHVTATLLEVRPGLASSPTMTELSACAVEVLVFGELYDECFREIIQQTEEKDESLVAKVEQLQKKSGECTTPLQGSDEISSVSQSAIAALRSLPQAHTPTDKLLQCVEFLEYVSIHFSSLFQGKCIDADTLLVMVCQHVVAANIIHLHAEVAFIEEFSRDEQLLNGKEGYALITLQASLHYLDSLDELPSDLSPNILESDVGGKQGN